VAKEPIGDTILRAIATIEELVKTVGDHDQILTKVADRLAEIDERLTDIEKAQKR
jgi:uncharacterized coiled-coil protein SlyX